MFLQGLNPFAINHISIKLFYETCSASISGIFCLPGSHELPLGSEVPMLGIYTLLGAPERTEGRQED